MGVSSDETVKFVCSYNGLILPRPTDGKLRYVGGFTRVLAVDRSISYAELMVKLVELTGTSVTLKCQLPNADLETLITIKSDEELSSIISQHSDFPNQKIRAVLTKPHSLKQVSPPLSSATSSNCSCSSCKLHQHQRKRYRYGAARVGKSPKSVEHRFKRIGEVCGNLGVYY